MTSARFDVLVAGGGMVGATAALTLAAGGLRVGLLEAVRWNTAGQPSYDDRSIALAEGSRRILLDLGLWPGLAEGVTPIRRIHVSDRGHFGAVRLNADEEGVPALGYVVENRVLGQSLFAALADSQVELFCPATVEQCVQEPAGDIRIQAQTEQGRIGLRAAVLVVADGAQSDLREQIGIDLRQRDYGQTAIISNVSTANDHRHCAYERFTDTGPLALLPMSGNRCSLVLTLTTAMAEEWMALDDADFLAKVQARFGRRLGRLTRIGRRAAYPLQLLQAVPQSRGRAVLVGNAARTLHPVAGQGFNLALRDVVSLAEHLLSSARDEIGEPAQLEAWVARRRRDQRLTVGWTDALVRVFSTGFAPVAHARAAGLVAMDLLPPLRHAFARRSMGLHGRRPGIVGLLEKASS